jgi:hypothetical protein
MTAFFKFLNDNAIASIIVAAAILGAVAWLRKMYPERRDSKKIYKFLVTSSAGPYRFRSTEAIASHTNLSEARVAELCATHSKIRRNENEKQSWTLVE